MKYLKVWQGFVTGSMGGRDDGYPETKYKLIDSLEVLVDTFDEKAEYYKLTPADVNAVVSAVNEFRVEEK